MTASVRAAVGADADVVHALVRRAYSQYVPLMDREPAPMLDDYAASIAAGRVVVAELDGVVVGALVGWADEQGDEYVDNVAVDPAAERQGIGGLLLDHTVERARSAGRRRVWLYTNAVMEANVGFYERRGFVQTGRRHEAGYDRIFFERTLPVHGR